MLHLTLAFCLPLCVAGSRIIFSFSCCIAHFNTKQRGREIHENRTVSVLMWGMWGTVTSLEVKLLDRVWALVSALCICWCRGLITTNGQWSKTTLQFHLHYVGGTAFPSDLGYFSTGKLSTNFPGVSMMGQGGTFTFVKTKSPNPWGLLRPKWLLSCLNLMVSNHGLPAIEKGWGPGPNLLPSQQRVLINLTRY